MTHKVSMKQASELYGQGIIRSISYKGIEADLDFGGAYWNEGSNAYRLCLTGRPDDPNDMSDIRGRVTLVQGNELVEIEFDDTAKEIQIAKRKQALIDAALAKLNEP